MNGRIHFIFQFSLVLIVIATLSASTPASEGISFNTEEASWLDHHPLIRVGIMNAWPPMDYVDGSGQPQGIGTQFIQTLNGRLGNRLKIVPGPWKEIYEAVKEKRLDALMDITPKEERKAFFNFTRSYLSIPHVYVGRKEGPSVDSAKDLFGKVIALEKGYYNARLFHERYPEVTVREYPSTEEALGAVSRGEADAYAGNRAVVMYLIEKELMFNLVVRGRMEKPPVRLNIGVRKDWPILADILDAALADISTEEIRKIHKTWMGELKIIELGLNDGERAWLTAKPVLRLGFDPDRPPVEFADSEGNYKGMSSDYMALIAETLGVTIQPGAPRSWQAAMDAAKKGELDLLSAVTRTPQLEQYFNFSHPYLSFPIVIVTDQRAAYINDMNELAGKTVTVVSGGGPHNILANNHPKIILEPVKNITQGLQAVHKGDVYAFVDNLASISHIMGREGITGLKVTGQTPYSCDLSIAVPKNQPVLAGLMEKALDAIDEERRTEIFNRWIAVTYESGIDTTLIWRILAVVLVILIAFTYWNRRLSKEVNERKLAQEALRKSEERFRTTIEQAPIGIVTLSENGQFHSFNTCFAEMLGYSIDELKTRSMKEIICPEEQATYGDSMKGLFLKAMRLVMERTYLKKNGTRMDGRTTVVSLLDNTGRVYAVLATVEDVTAEKKARSELRQAKEAAEKSNRNLIRSQERLALALKGGDLGFWDVNLVTGEMVVNHRWMEMVGTPHDALDNLTRDKWIRILHPDDRDRVLKVGEDYQKGGISSYEVEYRIITRSGETRWQFSKGEIVEKDEKNGVLRMVGTVMDITSRREAEEKLRQYMDELERFNRLAVGREKQIISLKQAVNSLLEQLGQEPKYRSVE